MIKYEDKIAVKTLLEKLENTSEKYPIDLKEDILFWESKGAILYNDNYGWGVFVGKGYMLIEGSSVKG